MRSRVKGLVSTSLILCFPNIDSLALYAGIHPVRFGHYRLLSRRFPYAVYYLLEGDVVVIRRVLDLRRNPLQTRRKLAHVKP